MLKAFYNRAGKLAMRFAPMADFLQKNLDRVHLGQPNLSEEAYQTLTQRLDLIQDWHKSANTHVRAQKAIAGSFEMDWGGDVQLKVFERLAAKNKALIERLRLIWWLSGWPIHNYTALQTFPIFDPTYLRYRKIKSATPSHLRFTAPAILCEAGWKEDGGIVNHDVAILQERLQFLHFSGVTHLFNQSNRFTAIELGSGHGGMALAFSGAYPQCTFALCDIPQVLIIAYVYLNVARPDASHFVATNDGLIRVDSLETVADPIEAFATPGFVYIPNYLLPEYEHVLRPTLALNAMSLHEMKAPAIEYYCATLSRMLKEHSGVFVEYNTLPGVPNAAIDERLARHFKACFEINLPSLAFRPRVWCGDQRTVDELRQHHGYMKSQYALDELFGFDFYFEWPQFNDSKMKRMIRAQTDQFLEVPSLPKSATGPLMGNHLRYIVRRGKGILT